jgi:hypothetical protein
LYNIIPTTLGYESVLIGNHLQDCQRGLLPTSFGETNNVQGVTTCTNVKMEVLRLIHTCHAAPMPCRVNSPIPCHAPALFRQCRVLRETPRGSRKYPNCYSYSLTGWYASGKSLRGTPRCSRKKPKAGTSSICRVWTADANSQYHTMPIPRCAVA